VLDDAVETAAMPGISITGSMDDLEDRELGCNVLKFGKWRVLVNRHVCPGAGRTLQVRLEHRRPLVYRDFFQVYRLVPAMVEGDVAPCCLHILHPASIRPKHGDQITLTGNDDHDQRQTDGLTGASAGHFKGNEVIWRNPQPIDGS
jgi:hypothetical protein